MSYPPVLSQESYSQALQDSVANVPGAREAIKAAQVVLNAVPESVTAGRCLGNGSGVFEAALIAAHQSPKEPPPPTPSVATLQCLEALLDDTGLNSREFSPARVFTETPISQPTSTPPMGTLGGGAEPLPAIRHFPLGKKLPARRPLTEDAELGIFDIYNIFRRRWFLSQDHLMTQIISAQKAEDGKIFWVEFTPHFHTHLVKCAVALVPRPIHKVKKVMFGFILELLNGEGPQTFFDLAKGPWLASKAQKEKKRLSRQRNRTSRRERRKAAEEAVSGKPHRQCPKCGRKFASRKAEKRHRCPLPSEASGKSGNVKDKGKTKADIPSNKPKSAKSRAPKTALPLPGDYTDRTSDRHSARLNTATKKRVWKEHDEDAQLAAVLAMSGGGQYQGNDNLEAQDLAARCLANLMEALPEPLDDRIEHLVEALAIRVSAEKEYYTVLLLLDLATGEKKQRLQTELHELAQTIEQADEILSNSLEDYRSETILLETLDPELENDGA
ncbi:hypothetical protein BGW80DRAFT_1460568 [Lactifluus volemus]|nr:hypothetical protein BGW80DRAFT_1460568 [Lactifluus volemus]